MGQRAVDQTLYSVQYIRALAALTVALFHFRPLFLSAGGSSDIARLADWGHAGVPLFFVVAGFIMVWTTRLRGATGQFMARRVVRIYGGYLPVFAAFLAYKACTTGIDYWVPDGLNFWGSLLLIETDARQLLIYPAWTLPYELVFYSMFGGCLLAGPRRFLGVFLISAVTAVILSKLGLLPFGLTTILSDPISLSFVLGVISGVYACGRNGQLDGPAALIGLLFIGLGIAQGDAQDPLLRSATYGLGLALVLPGLARLERAGKLPGLYWPARLGDASYAIYLLHMPIIFVLQTTPTASLIAWHYGPAALAAVYLCGVTLLSLLYLTLVDEPLQRVAKSFKRSQARSDTPVQHSSGEA